MSTEAAGPLATDRVIEDLVGRPGVKVLHVTNDPTLTVARQALRNTSSVRSASWRQIVWDDLRRDLAAPDVLSARLGSLGISREDQVVLVGERIQFASYVYWALSMFGHDAALVFDGTWDVFESRPASAELTAGDRPKRVHYGAGTWDLTTRIRYADVLALVNQGVPNQVHQLVDLRSSDEYSGRRVAPPTAKADEGAVSRGHIPGAVSFDYRQMLAQEGGLAPLHYIRDRREAAGLSDERPEIVYCRMGHRASLAWFVFTRLLGVGTVRVYDGSWVEWGNVVGAPVQR